MEDFCQFFKKKWVFGYSWSTLLWYRCYYQHRLTVSLPPLPEIGCPIFLEIWSPLGKVMERSGLTFEHFCFEVVLFSSDFALQNIVETTLPDGLETSGQRAYR